MARIVFALTVPLCFPLTAPDGQKCYRFMMTVREAPMGDGKKSIDDLIAKNELIWKKREAGGDSVHTREFAPANPSRPYKTIWNDLDTTRQTKAHQKTLFGEDVFDTPKPGYAAPNFRYVYQRGRYCFLTHLLALWDYRCRSPQNGSPLDYGGAG